ncbi:transposase [Halosquirtibacter xylanolyticus]|nr:transposase [Prolixibacteraceae bacterium]
MHNKVTLDLTGVTEKVVSKCFPQASKVMGHFHVQKLAYDALQ